jgi:hypothetical protein
MKVCVLACAALATYAAAQTSPADVPDAAAQQAMIFRMRQAALEYGDRLQNFTCLQTTARSVGPSAAG